MESKRCSKKRLFAFILILTIFIATIHNDKLFAEKSNVNANNFPLSFQAQSIDVQVKEHSLNGKHEQEDLRIPDYKDGILSTLDGNVSFLSEENNLGDVFVNDTGLFGVQYTVSAGEIMLNHSIVLEENFNLNGNHVSASDRCIVFSKSGSIDIKADKIDFSGILYAPEGTITLTGKEVSVQGAVVAKNIIVVADKFEMDGYEDSDMEKLAWVQDTKLNNDSITIDEEKKVLILTLSGKETDIYHRKSDIQEFALLDTTAEETYEIPFEQFDGIVDIRTVTKKYGEEKLSMISTFQHTGEMLEECNLDSDGDGVPDGYEIWELGTNSNLADSDLDGFSDGYEVFVLCSNPLAVTEDGDSDGDGIFDQKEMELGTSPFVRDTDFDGFSDDSDAEPLIADVKSGLQPDYEIHIPIGIFDICERYYDENGEKFEVVYNYVNGQRAYLRNSKEETKKLYDLNGNETASISKVDGAYIVNTYSYDEDGNQTSMTHNGMRYDFTYDKEGNVLESQLGEETLEKNTYDGELLTETVHGNGDVKRHEYDESGNLIKTYENDVLVYEWEYEGHLPLTYQDFVSEKTYTYEYDEQGYLKKTICSDGFETEYLEDGENQEIRYSYNGESWNKTTQVIEENEGYVNVELSYGEDTYIAILEGDTLETHFKTAEQDVVAETTFEITGFDMVEKEISDTTGEVEYAYNDSGFITEVVKEGDIVAAYAYDNLNQLVREDSAEKQGTTTYEYDMAGNMVNTTEYELGFDREIDSLQEKAETEYAYADENFTDLLTSYNGNEITYDEIGNPIRYHNGMEFGWTGKQLHSVHKSGTSIAYQYDADGLRIGKQVDGKRTEFVWENGNLVAEIREEGILWYMHDVNGDITGFQLNGESYYYSKNLQGDVTAIVDEQGEILVEYAYDTWGKGVSITGDETLGEMNPIRYRGYYQDNETSFYYLQSRYYDTETKRFLNTDDIFDYEANHAKGNLYAYAANNSVMRIDPTGGSSVLVTIGALLIVLVLVYYLSSVFVKTWYKNIDKITAAMDRGLRRISSTLSIYDEIANALWRQIGASFAKATRKYNTTETHHIVAKGATKATAARNALHGIGLSVESSRNKIELKKGLHKRLHTNSYYAITNTIVDKCYKMSPNKIKREKNVRGALTIMKDSLWALNKMAPF